MAGTKYVRPQKHNSWFNVMPVRDFTKMKSRKVPFLDSFVTIESHGKESYNVYYEGEKPMYVTVQYGFICVWFGDNLEKPDWPFPILFDENFGHDFIISEPRVFKDTNLLDLIENNGDPIHFKTVHKWLEIKLSDHVYTDRKYSLKMKGKVQYARSADSAIKRSISKLLPTTEYAQELSFHGPGFGAGNIVTEPDINAHLILAFTPLGDNDLKLHLAASIKEKSLPWWLRQSFSLNPFLSLHDVLSWALVKAGVDDTDGDYRIWHTKRSLKDPKLLPGEDNIVKIREWMSTFYLKDFKQPKQKKKTKAEKSWSLLGKTSEIKNGKVNRFTVSGEELIAVKNIDGELNVFEAHCPHQGAHLGYGGELEDDCISCPFHKFYFNSEGKYVGSTPKGKPKDTMKLAKINHKILEDKIEVFV